MRLKRQALFALVPLLGAVPAFAGAQTLLPHRAVYELALADVMDSAQIEALAGRWVFEFAGSACEGYTLTSRIVMRFEMTDGPRLLDQQVSTFEDGAGETFRFSTRSYVDQVLESEVRGTAQLADSETVVEYEMPEQVEHSFEPTIFPTGQLRQLLEKAEAGEHFYQSAIFDGTEFTDKAMQVSVVVGSPRPVAESDPEREVLGDLAAESFMPVTAAYFDGEATDGEQTSSYNVSFKLHESGIQRDMVIRYNEYSMTARLAELTLHEPDKDCEGEAAP